ncbi:MAG TPA: thermonuclease family protein [Candidatus Saccharimonadales bacterium]
MSQRNNSPKKILWLTSALFIGILSYVAPQVTSLITQHVPAAEPGYHKVVSFADGDTITVDMNGQHEKVRMIGVDTPEKNHPDKPKQCYSTQASQFTKNKIVAAGTVVRLEADPLNDPRDRYNRLLRYVYLRDGTLLNKQLVSEGYGFAYTLYPFAKTTEFTEAHTQAQTAMKGLWQHCQATKKGNSWSTNSTP